MVLTLLCASRCRGNIRVFCRVRPVVDAERRTGRIVDVTSYPIDDDIVIRQVVRSCSLLQVALCGCSHTRVCVVIVAGRRGHDLKAL